MPRVFDFVSPGVEIREVDQSQVTTPSEEDGIVLIGMAKSGPGNQPVKVRTIEDFVTVFGNPQAGVGNAESDVWREGNSTVPTYASYAAQAWLASETSPVTFVRLLGKDSPDQAAGYVKAGWDLGTPAVSKVIANNKLAYGIWLIKSASSLATNVTGTLAAIIYAQGAALSLNGDVAGCPSAKQVITSSAGTFIKSISTAAKPATFKLDIWTGNQTTPTETHTFHFDPDEKDGYIRNVLNTNPHKLDSNNYAATETKKYFLGETFEESVKRLVTDSSTTAGQQLAFIAPLVSGSAHWASHQAESKPAKSGWIISRDPDPTNNVSAFTASAQTKLFRICSLHDGEWFQNNYYAAIEDLKLGTVRSPNSTFTLCIKDIRGNRIESFSNLTLDLADANFIGKRVGTRRLEWNTTTKQYDEFGDYDNVSSYVRIELAESLKTAGGLNDKHALPFGFFGPAKPKGFTYLATGLQGQNHAGIYKLGTLVSSSANTFPQSFIGSGDSANIAVGGHFTDSAGQSYASTVENLSSSISEYTASFVWPRLRLTEPNTKAGNNWLKTDYLGIRHKVANKNTNKVYDDKSYIDLIRYLGAGLDIHETATDTSTEPSFVFTLDEVQKINNKFFFASGSHGKGDGTAALSLNNISETAASGSKSILDDRVKQFNIPFFGGFDGLDITQIDPFSSNNILDSKAVDTHYANYSIERALDSIRDPEVIRYDVACMPGLTNTALSNKLLEDVEERGDALAIIDIQDGYRESYENGGTRLTTGGTVETVLQQAATRDLDTSYGAAYFPRIRMRDTLGENGNIVVAPASVGAIGALAFSEANSDGPWFAPAGFNRGGLAQLGGSQGPRVIGTWKNLSKADRDDLYQENINPIARFPAIGEIVIFGQKTLQATPSALDRVNVRRLMIYLKKKIKDVADTTLFDPNVQTTWNRFKVQADLVLADVQSRFGIEEYKIVLDDTTTTETLVDQNILYSKIFVKPTKAIEFIAIDFIITRSGIEF